MAKRYVSNKDESVPLFENKLMDKFTYVHPSIPVILYAPVISFFLFQAFFRSDISVFTTLALFLGGLMAWTFTEYLIHRFVFHFEPTSELGKYISHLSHGIHHDYPNDSRRLVMPPVVSIPLALSFYGLFSFLFAPAYVLAFFPGFVFGYVCYDMIHYATHHFSMKGPIGSFLRKHHLKHHYQQEELGFGVSSPMWDVVFRTEFQEK